MANINENFLNPKSNFVFQQIIEILKSSKVDKSKLINLSIGDVIKPIVPEVVSKIHKAVDEMANKNTYKSYPPYQGYSCLINKILEYDYSRLGIEFDSDEVFISDGTNSDMSNIQELFHQDNKIAIPNPVYPIYVASNILAGKLNIEYINCTEENNFIPSLPNSPVDIIYLCYPNNPTGTVLNYSQLQEWVNYAKQHKSIILYDSIYEAFIQDDNIPHSIYEIEGAKEVAIEFRSYSKMAGFTGLRCAYTIVPKELQGYTQLGEQISINKLWHQRQSTKFFGVSYLSQQGALAIYTSIGRQQIMQDIKDYQTSASIIKQGLTNAGFIVYGGIHAPYLWIKTIGTKSSWEFFKILLEEVNIVCTTGIGFGQAGEGFIRITSFCDNNTAIEVVKRFTQLKSKLR